MGPHAALAEQLVDGQLDVHGVLRRVVTDKIATAMFYRSRLEYIAETAGIARRVTRLLVPSRLQHKENEASIKERLKKTLEKHKDEAEADPVRDSEDRMKQDLADTNQKLADMEKKLAGMLQDLLEKK